MTLTGLGPMSMLETDDQDDWSRLDEPAAEEKFLALLELDEPPELDAPDDVDDRLLLYSPDSMLLLPDRDEEWGKQVTTQQRRKQHRRRCACHRRRDFRRGARRLERRHGWAADTEQYRSSWERLCTELSKYDDKKQWVGRLWIRLKNVAPDGITFQTPSPTGRPHKASVLVTESMPLAA